MSLGTVSSLRNIFSVGELVGAQCNSKKFERNHLGAIQGRPWRLNRSWYMPVTAPESRRSARLQSAREVLLLDSDEPTTYSEAMVGSDSESWLGAMRSELKSMDENQVWNLVDLPDGARPVECKWVFKKKLTWMEMFLSIKHGLSRKGSDRFKELTMTRPSRP